MAILGALQGLNLISPLSRKRYFLIFFCIGFPIAGFLAWNAEYNAHVHLSRKEKRTISDTVAKTLIKDLSGVKCDVGLSAPGKSGEPYQLALRIREIFSDAGCLTPREPTDEGSPPSRFGVYWRYSPKDSDSKLVRATLDAFISSGIENDKFESPQTQPGTIDIFIGTARHKADGENEDN